MSSDPTDLLLGPYVTGVTEIAAKVLWVPSAAAGAAGKLFLKMAGGGRNEVASREVIFPPGPEVIRIADVTALEAGTVYDYTLEIGDGVVNGSFQTAPRKGSREPFKFIMYGDNRSGPERHCRVLDAACLELPVVFITNTGDLTANAGSWRQWKEEFFGPGREMFRRTTFWPVRGNHEVDAVLYRAVFDAPGKECYYSVDVGNLHYVVLDSELLDFERNPAAHAEMVRWLEQDLANCKADWIIGSSHVPIFNIGGDGSTWGRTDVLGILEKYGVDIFISSHSHLYERFRPIGPAGKKPIVHIVSGGGGGPAYELRPSPILAKNYSGLHFCVFHANGQRLEMTVKTPEGAVVDEMTLEKSSGKFSSDTMADALTTREAMDLAFVSSARLKVDYLDVPVPGRACRVSVKLHDGLPTDATLRLASVADCGWGVPATDFQVGATPFELLVRPPENVEVRSGFVRPPLAIRRSVTLRGHAYEATDVIPSLTEDSIRRFVPVPSPLSIPHAPAGMKIDGDFEKWNKVPLISKTANGQASRAARFAWGAEGLFGFICEPGPANDSGPRVDMIELFIESDCGRSLDAHYTPHASQFCFAPNRELGPGRATVGAGGPYKYTPQLVPARWGMVGNAEAVEFLIPADALMPARMTAGSRIGFYYWLWAGGRRVEEFIDTEGKTGVWMRPLYWGSVVLG